MEGFPWWTDRQKELAGEVSAFVDKIMPKARELVWKREYPWELLREIAKKGWFGVAIPQKYGGMEMGFTGCCIVMEQLSRAGGLVYPFLVTQCGGTEQLLGFGTEEQKKKWLSRIAKGEMGAVVATEAYAGTDIATIETTARKEGDVYIINGKKRYTTNAPSADLYVVYAKTSEDKEDRRRYRHLSAFIVEKKTKGFTTEKVNELIGFDNIYNSYSDFEEVKVPVENMIGKEGQGWEVMMAGFNIERTITAASALGALIESIKYANYHMSRRIQFGRRVADMPTNQFKLADMILNLNIARLMTYYAAYLIDLEIPPAVEAASAKLFTTEMATKTTLDAIQCMGGDALTKFYPIESFLRDSKIMHLAAGSSEAMKLVIHRGGLRAMREDLFVPRMKIHPDLGVPMPVAPTAASSSPKSKDEVKEEDVLAALAEFYMTNLGLHMTREELKQDVGEISDEKLDEMLKSLGDKGLASLYRGRKGNIEMTRATIKGLKKAKPLKEYKWFPEWVKKEDIV